MTRIVKGGARPRVVRAGKRAVGAVRKERFLAQLAATCNVTLACDAAKVSNSHVYRMRREDAAFRAGWAQALAEGYARLEMTMLERAMNGVVKDVRRADGSVDRITEYSDRVALQLLRMHKDVAEEAAVEPDGEEVEAARRRVLRRLEKLKARFGDAG